MLEVDEQLAVSFSWFCKLISLDKKHDKRHRCNDCWGWYWRAGIGFKPAPNRRELPRLRGCFRTQAFRRRDQFAASRCARTRRVGPATRFGRGWHPNQGRVIFQPSRPTHLPRSRRHCCWLCLAAVFNSPRRSANAFVQSCFGAPRTRQCGHGPQVHLGHARP